jgi:hypothetical protein
MAKRNRARGGGIPSRVWSRLKILVREETRATLQRLATNDATKRTEVVQEKIRRCETTACNGGAGGDPKATASTNGAR